MTTTGSGAPAPPRIIRGPGGRRAVRAGGEPRAPGAEPPPSFGERIRQSFDRWWFAYAMLVPVFVVMALLVFYPLGRGIYLSFTNADQFTIGGKDLPAAHT